RLVHRLDLPQPEAGDQLLRLGEGAVDHGLLPAREPDALPLRTRVEPLTREHHAGLHQFFVELPHRREDFLAGEHAGLGVLVRLDQYHDAHRKSPSGFGFGAGAPVSIGRLNPRSIDTSNEGRRDRQGRQLFLAGFRKAVFGMTGRGAARRLLAGPPCASSGAVDSDYFWTGCSSNVRTNSSNPSDWSKILPAAGKTSEHSLTVWPLTRTVTRGPAHRHSTRFHSPGGFSTSSRPRVSSSSLKSQSCFDHQSWPRVGG